MLQLRDYNESYLSRRHFTLECVSDGVWQIRDGQWNMDAMAWVQSTNGTYVNSTAATKDGLGLRNGDIITAGDIKLRFETK